MAVFACYSHVISGYLIVCNGKSIKLWLDQNSAANLNYVWCCVEPCKTELAREIYTLPNSQLFLTSWHDEAFDRVYEICTKSLSRSYMPGYLPNGYNPMSEF